ncbi:hypothetical protein Tco_0791252 [Tanacetum coccineum]
MADNRTMAQLLEAPTEGYEDAIVIPEITANNFEIKHGLLNLVQNKQFFGNDKEDPHAHIRYFNKITFYILKIECEITFVLAKKPITFNLDQTSKYTADYNHMTVNKIDVIDMACDEYSQEVLGFSSVVASGNPTPYFEPIVSTASPTLTPFGDSDFLLFEEADSFLALEDDPTSSEVDPTYQDPEGDILILEAILNTKTIEPSIDEPPEVELKELPPHLEYAFLEGDNKLPVIIAKDLKDEEKAALLKVLKSHKRAIAWKLSDIKGVSPEFCTHKILMEEDYEPSVQSQRRVNPKIHDVIKKEVEKLLDAGLIYPISDSPWRLRNWGSPRQRIKTSIFTYKYASMTMNGLNSLTTTEKGNYCLWCMPLRVCSYLVHVQKQYILTILPSSIFLPSRVLWQDSCGGSYGSMNLTLKIRDKKEMEELAAIFCPDLNIRYQDKLENKDQLKLFRSETLGFDCSSRSKVPLWIADLTHYHAGKFLSRGMTFPNKNINSLRMSNIYFGISFPIKICADQLIRRCVSGQEALDILKVATVDSTGGHYRCNFTARKIFDSGFICPPSTRMPRTLSPV